MLVIPRFPQFYHYHILLKDTPLQALQTAQVSSQTIMCFRVYFWPKRPYVIGRSMAKAGISCSNFDGWAVNHSQFNLITIRK